MSCASTRQGSSLQLQPNWVLVGVTLQAGGTSLWRVWTEGTWSKLHEEGNLFGKVSLEKDDADDCDTFDEYDGDSPDECETATAAEPVVELANSTRAHGGHGLIRGAGGPLLGHAVWSWHRERP